VDSRGCDERGGRSLYFGYPTEGSFVHETNTNHTVRRGPELVSTGREPVGHECLALH
jgi:hypothetical protein